MDIQSIKTFLQVANLENFTKAAEEMNYAQSTVTMQIQRLEHELGFPLFERIGRKNYLTSAGLEFLPHAREILLIMQKVTTLGKDSADIHGTLRIGVLESLLFSTALQILPDFRQRYPNVDIQFKIGQASELLKQLKQNQLDIIYVSNALNSDSSISCCYRRKEEIIFVAGASHPLAQKKHVSLDALLSYPFIMAEPSGRCFIRLHEIATECNQKLRYSVIVDNIIAIVKLLQDQQSISFLPSYSLVDEIKNGELVKLDVDIPPQPYYSQLLYHVNKWVPPYMDYFIQLVRDARPEYSKNEFFK